MNGPPFPGGTALLEVLLNERDIPLVLVDFAFPFNLFFFGASLSSRLESSSSESTALLSSSSEAMELRDEMEERREDDFADGISISGSSGTIKSSSSKALERDFPAR